MDNGEQVFEFRGVAVTFPLATVSTPAFRPINTSVRCGKWGAFLEVKSPRLEGNLTSMLSRTNSTEQSPSSPQLVKKFPAFYGTRKFITTFTSACHLSLS
jgi:hypothetical protein